MLVYRDGTPAAPLVLLLLVKRRLDREALAALATQDLQFQFQPLMAPSAYAAERMLAEADSARYVALIEGAMVSPAARALFRQRPPAAIVELQGDTASASRSACPGKKSRRFCRDTPWRELANALVAEASSTVPAAQPDIKTRVSRLTRRERQILELISTGASVRECAETLAIAESTVDNHKSRLMKKLGVSKSVELVRLAFRLGIAS